MSTNPLEAFAAHILELSEKATPGNLAHDGAHSPHDVSLFAGEKFVGNMGASVSPVADVSADGTVELIVSSADVANAEKIAHLWNHATTLAAIASAAAECERALVATQDEESRDRSDCDECGGECEPEACGTCFPAADDARVKRMTALAAIAAVKKEMET